MSEEGQKFRDKEEQTREERKENRKQALSERAYDLFTCFKISGIVFGVVLTLALIASAIVGIKNGTFGIKLIVDWVFTFGVWIGAAGMFLSGVAFLKPKFMEDLTHQKQWRTHFYRMNFIGVMFTVCIYLFVYVTILDYIRVYAFYR